MLCAFNPLFQTNNGECFKLRHNRQLLRHFHRLFTDHHMTDCCKPIVRAGLHSFLSSGRLNYILYGGAQ
jgi:hypothetical protein